MSRTSSNEDIRDKTFKDLTSLDEVIQYLKAHDILVHVHDEENSIILVDYADGNTLYDLIEEQIEEQSLEHAKKTLIDAKKTLIESDACVVTISDDKPVWICLGHYITSKDNHNYYLVLNGLFDAPTIWVDNEDTCCPITELINFFENQPQLVLEAYHRLDVEYHGIIGPSPEKFTMVPIRYENGVIDHALYEIDEIIYSQATTSGNIVEYLSVWLIEDGERKKQSILQRTIVKNMKENTEYHLVKVIVDLDDNKSLVAFIGTFLQEINKFLQEINNTLKT